MIVLHILFALLYVESSSSIGFLVDFTSTHSVLYCASCSGMTLVLEIDLVDIECSRATDHEKLSAISVYRRCRMVSIFASFSNDDRDSDVI